MLEVTIHGTTNPLSLLSKIKPSPDSNRTEYRVLGVKLTKDFEVIGRLSAIDSCLGILRLDALKLVFAYLALSQLFSQVLAARSLSVLDFVTP